MYFPVLRLGSEAHFISSVVFFPLGKKCLCWSDVMKWFVYFLYEEKAPNTRRASAPSRHCTDRHVSLCFLFPLTALMTFPKVAKESFGLPWEPGASRTGEF